MNETLERLLKTPGFQVNSLAYSYNVPGTILDFDIKASLSTTASKEPINELENMNTKLVTQDNFINAIKGSNRYIVGSVDSAGTLSFAQNPAYHTSTVDARAECKRLAKQYPGKLYIFVGLQGGEMVPANSISI